MIARHWHNRRRSGVVFTLAIVALSGCTGTSEGPVPSAAQQAAMNDPIAIFAGSATPGTAGAVTLPETGQAVQVRVVRAYAAASGRECREVAIGNQGLRVYCRIGNGWIAARPLLTNFSPQR